MSSITERITVCLLHSGSTEDQKFIQDLEVILVTSNRPGLVLEYYDFQEGQQKEAVIYLNLKKYKDRKLPLLALISKAFLELVWKSPYKMSILTDLINYSSNKNLHIWVDELNEKEIMTYSTALCRTDGQFRTITSEYLYSLLEQERVNTICAMLNDTSEKISFSNYSVQEELEQKRKANDHEALTKKHASVTDDSTDESLSKQFASLTHHNVSKGATATVTTSLPSSKVKSKQRTKPPKKKRESHYKDVANWMTIPGMEAEADNHVNDFVPSSSDSGASASVSTSKQRKKQKTTAVKLMKDLPYNAIHHISLLLDVGYGANWKQIAYACNFDAVIISNIELALQCKESPTQNLLHLLRTRKPELDVKDFMEKCRNISRNDVVCYMQQNIC